MKRKDIFNPLALFLSKRKLKKAFSLESFDSIYDFAQSYVGRGYYDRISLHQFKNEFRCFADYIKNADPKVIVEIGTKKGGSFFVWARYIKPKHLISIDLPGGIHGGGFAKQKIGFMKYFLADCKDSKVSIILGDSHKKETYDRLVNELNGKQIDFLFIDGDHRYEGVKSDYQMYSNLVKEGGIIAFHDIVESEYHHDLDCYVDVFWNEVKINHEYIEFIERPEQHKYGIGVLKI